MRRLAFVAITFLFAAALFIGSAPSVGASTYGEDCLTLTGVQAYGADSRTGYNTVTSYVGGPHTVYLNYTLIRSDQDNGGLCHQYDIYIYLTDSPGWPLVNDYLNLSLYMTLRVWKSDGTFYNSFTFTCGAEQSCHIVEPEYPDAGTPNGDNWETSYYNRYFSPTSNYVWLHGV